jgi:hypothetical protein
MTPVGWARAGMAWGYAAAWFVILDLLKKLTYRFSGTIHGSREKESQKKARRDSR